MRINPASWVYASVVVAVLALPVSRLGAAGPDFRAEVAGHPLELHEFTQGAFAPFECDSPTEVIIRTGFDVRWVNVRPRSSGIAATIAPDHRSVRFRISGTLPFPVEFNDDLARVVHLFPYAPDREFQRTDRTNVRFFGPGVHEAGLIDLRD